MIYCVQRRSSAKRAYSPISIGQVFYHNIACRKTKPVKKGKICGAGGLPVRSTAGKVQIKMGKGNRSRTQRAVDVLSAPASSAAKNTSKTKRITVIATAVTALILVFFICVGVFTSTGLLNKMRSAIKSDNYSIDGNLMNYFIASEYQSVMQYATYYGIDTSKKLSAQEISEGTTWADYITNMAASEVQQLVVLCNEADKRGIKLTDEDKKNIDDAIASVAEAAESAGYTTSGYLGAVYGTGINESVVRKAMEMQSLASACYDVLQKEFTDGVTDEKINTYFSEHEKDFLTAKTLQYAFTATLDTGDNAEATDEQKNAYKDAQAAKKALADKLAAATGEEEFMKLVADAIIDDNASAKLAANYSTEINKHTMTDDGKDYSKMTDDDIAAAIEYFKAHIAEEKTEAENLDTPENPDNEYYYKLSVISAMSSTLSSLQSTYSAVEKETAYVDPEGENVTDLNKWIFDKDRKANDTTVISSEADTTSTYTAVFTKSPAARDETVLRNAAHILFKLDEHNNDADACRELAEKAYADFQKGEMTLDAFKALAEGLTEDTGVTLDNVAPGQTVEGFDDWLFDEARKANDVAVVDTVYGSHVVFYVGEGDAAWYSSVKETIINEELNNWFETSVETYNVKVNDKTMNKLASQY